MLIISSVCVRARWAQRSRFIGFHSVWFWIVGCTCEWANKYIKNKSACFPCCAPYTHSFVHYLFQPICICATDRMQICLLQMNMVELKRMLFFSTQLYSMPYTYTISSGLLNFDCWLRGATNGGLKKVLAHHAALLISMICIHTLFSIALTTHTHFWNVIFSRFCAFHSVYWPIKMLGNKFACFFFFLCCINSIEDFTRFVSEWRTIYSHVTRNLRPTTQSIIPNIKSGPL